MRSRNYYMHKFQKTKDPSDWEQYRSLRNKVKKELRIAKKEFLEELCSNLGNEPSKVWGELTKPLVAMPSISYSNWLSNNNIPVTHI